MTSRLTRTFTWAIGDIVPGRDSSFVFRGHAERVTYDTAVISYDLVSGPGPAQFPR